MRKLPLILPKLKPGENETVINQKDMSHHSYLILVAAFILIVSASGLAQTTEPNPADSGKKRNQRPAEATVTPEPFDGATVERMASQCVTLETELGAIEIAMMPEVAPESVRNFLNLAATGAFDTTTFSRTVKDFVIQGGNLSTSDKWNADLARRMTRKVPDEPGIVKHVRGIVSMARTDEPNSSTTHFFILVGDGPHLDSKFSAFGTVTKGIEVADAINRAPADGEKPDKPVRINRAVVVPCKK
ncbi:MAG TPA: peptidylprolyl isomerase [Pyrinomonadaceae bacterium]|nr:peptidylprolyl isomerase [Pyrinomonadaceae bacterium]